MRYISQKIKDLFINLHNYNYCFDITLTDGEKLYFTSSNKLLKLNDIIFIPNSGLTIEEGVFNDSGQDYIRINGIFEPLGIDKQLDLTGAKIKIIVHASGQFYDLITFFCTEYTKFDLNFKILLQPSSIKYNQTLLISYSKTCRTNFGDNKCKADKKLFSSTYELIEVTSKYIKISNMDKENGYYIGGDAIFNEGHIVVKIINSAENILYLNKVVLDKIRLPNIVTLVAGCDKKFITCCNKFNNEVNFRGEPLIPQQNFLKIF